MTKNNTEENPADINNKDDNKGVVYIMKCLDYYKIGIAKLGSTRFGEYTTLMAPVTYICSEICNNYKEVEKELHKKFFKQNTNGEWFQLDDKMLAEAKKYISKYSIGKYIINKKEEKYEDIFNGDGSENEDHIYQIEIKDGNITYSDGYVKYIKYRLKKKSQYQYCKKCGCDDFILIDVGPKYKGKVKCARCGYHQYAGNTSINKWFNPHFTEEAYVKTSDGDYVYEKYYPTLKTDTQVINSSCKSDFKIAYGFTKEQAIDTWLHDINQRLKYNNKMIDTCTSENNELYPIKESLEIAKAS